MATWQCLKLGIGVIKASDVKPARQSNLSARHGQLGEGGFQGVGVRARGKRVAPSTCDVATNPFAGEFHDDCQTTL